MNILHISSASTWRGGERQIKFLMEGLSLKGHSNFLMAPKVSVLGFRTIDVIISKISFRRGLFSIISNIFSLVSFCRQNKIDIIHGHDSHAHSLLWLAYKFGGLKTKSIITRRLLNPIKSRSEGKYNYKKIEFIICISKAVRSVLSTSINNKKRLKVIHSGIDLTTGDSIRNKKKDNTKFVIGYVAAFTKEKDHITFCKTAKHITNTYPDLNIKYILVGDGPLIEKIKILSIRDNLDIQFLGFIEEVNKSYFDMDILLHTSRSEALGTSILDAQKYGIPVVATNVGGIPEIITDGKNGFLCNAGDYQNLAEAVYKLSTDKETYEAFSKNAYEILSKFDKSTMVAKILDLYEELV